MKVVGNFFGDGGFAGAGEAYEGDTGMHGFLLREISLFILLQYANFSHFLTKDTKIEKNTKIMYLRDLYS